MIGYSATRAMSRSDGDTMNHARRRSGTPRERRRVVPAAVGAVAVAMGLERGQRLLHLGLPGLKGILWRGLPRQRLVDVLVDRRGDLRVDRRDRTGLRLRDRLLQLRREGVLLLDVRIVVRRREHGGLGVLQLLHLLVLLARDEVDVLQRAARV